MNYILLDNTVGSSLVNFCEHDNYSSLFVETLNTWSSLVISLFGIIGIIKLYYFNDYNNLFKKYSDLTLKHKLVLRSVRIINILYNILILIGFGSLIFHGQMSQFAHWIDIAFISLILILSDYYLDNLIENRIVLIHYIIGLFHLTTSIIMPSIHIFIQFATGFMIVKKINYHIKKLKDHGSDNYDIEQIYFKIQNQYYKIKLVFYLSLIFWIIDYFGCRYINPLHTHWIFHIGIGWVGYSAIDLSKYLYLTETVIVHKNIV